MDFPAHLNLIDGQVVEISYTYWQATGNGGSLKFVVADWGPEFWGVAATMRAIEAAAAVLLDEAHNGPLGNIVSVTRHYIGTIRTETEAVAFP